MLVGGGRCPSLFRLLLGLVVVAVGQIMPIAFRPADYNMTILSGVWHVYLSQYLYQLWLVAIDAASFASKRPHPGAQSSRFQPTMDRFGQGAALAVRGIDGQVTGQAPGNLFALKIEAVDHLKAVGTEPCWS